MIAFPEVTTPREAARLMTSDMRLTKEEAMSLENLLTASENENLQSNEPQK